MQRAALVHESRGQYRQALNMWSSFISAYPDRARAVDAERRADELVLQIGGLTEEEARLWVTIENANRAESERGRRAILELGRLLIYEGGRTQASRNLVFPMLEEVVDKADTAPAQAGRAAFLLAESFVRRSRPEEAADYFLQAAQINPEDQAFVAESLYRAAEMMGSAGNTAERDEIIRRLNENFPESEWSEQARQLQENA
jgi:outer membrane protein assembly factor BamD (BamD/ComL family)